MPQFAPQDLTSNTSHPPFVVSTGLGEYFPAWHVFDGTANTTWVVLAHSGYVALDIGAGNSKTLDSYDVQFDLNPGENSSYNTRAPKDWTLEGSNDGSSWSTLDTQTGQTAWGDSETRTYTLGSPSAAYRYFRLNVSANNGDGLLQVGSLALYGESPATDYPYTGTGGGQSGGATVYRFNRTAYSYVASGGGQSGGASVYAFSPLTQHYSYIASGGGQSGGAASTSGLKIHPAAIASSGAVGTPSVSASIDLAGMGIPSAGGAGAPAILAPFADPTTYVAIYIDGDLKQHLVRSMGSDGRGVKRQMRVTGGSKSTCTFVLTNKHGFYRPSQGDEVAIYQRTREGVVTFFRGLIDKISELDYTGSAALNEIVCDCVDFGSLLDRVIVGREFQTQVGNDPYILTYQVAHRYFEPAFGIKFVWTGTDIVPYGGLGNQIFNWLTGTEVMNRIAQDSGGDWRVDYDRNLYLFAGGGGYKTAPFALADDDGNWRNLTVDRDYSKYKNKIYLKTSQNTRPLWTDTFTVATGEFLWITMAPLSSKPMVKVDGVAAVVVDFDRIGSRPYDFYWIGTTVIANPAHLPAAGAVLTVSYPSPLSYVAIAQNDAEIAAHGLFEGVEEVKDVPTGDALQAYANALLARRLNRPTTLRFETDRDGLEAGMSIQVNLSRPLVSGQFMLTDVSSVEVGKGLFFRHSVTAIDCASQGLGDSAAFYQSIVAAGRQPRDRVTLHVIFQIAETIPGIENPGLQLDSESGQRAVRGSPGKGIGISCSLYFYCAIPTSIDCILDLLQNGVSVFPGGDAVSLLSTYRALQAIADRDQAYHLAHPLDSAAAAAAAASAAAASAAHSTFAAAASRKMIWPAGATAKQITHEFYVDPLPVEVPDIWTLAVLQADANAKDGALDFAMLVG